MNDGWLDIQFIPLKDHPCVAAIYIHSNEYDKRINCGGPEYEEYQADWPPTENVSRDLASEDFYLDWAAHLFGTKAAEPVAALFKEIDGKLPRPSDWVNGPGGIKPDKRPWKEVQKEYDFVDQLAKLQSRVRGKGNRERFDYWLNNFRFMKVNAKVNCLWHEFNEAMKQVKEEEESKQARLARRLALPLRKKLVKAVGKVYEYLLPTVTTTGELGTLVNWEQHILPSLITAPGEELEQILGKPLPPNAHLPMEYKGEARVFVPNARTSVSSDETVSLRVIVLDKRPARGGALHWREMGVGEFQDVPLIHINRGVYTVQFPPEALTVSHLEYFIEVKTDSGRRISFPPTAPELNQTLVVVP